MKHLIILLTLIACHPLRNLQVSPVEVPTITIDSTKATVTLKGGGHDWIYLHDAGMPCRCAECKDRHLIDTIPAKLLISHDAPAFGHVVNGACIYRDGACTGKHLRYWHKRWVVVGPEYVVWGCKRANAPKK